MLLTGLHDCVVLHISVFSFVFVTSSTLMLVNDVPTDGQNASSGDVCSLAGDGIQEQVAYASSVRQEIYKLAGACNTFKHA